jgi:hypothetical protein
MKVSVDDQELFTLSDVQKNVIKHDIASEIFDEDCKRRLQWVLLHKYEQCYKRLKEKWEPVLASRYTSIPTHKDDFAQLVFSQPDYADKTAQMIADTNLG